jgi:hypothetical protein
MASRLWTWVKNLVDGQTARTDPINLQLQQIDGAFALAAAELDRSFRFSAGAAPGNAFLLSHTPAQRALQLLGFDQVGNPGLRSGTFTWRGSWTAATFYNANDMVIGPAAAPHYSSLYVCAIAHTAGVFATDLAAARWQVAIDLTQMNRFIRRFEKITANRLAVAGDDLFVDVGGGAVSITLPTAPLISDQPITVCHVAGNIAANAITIARNGKLIMGLAEDMTVNTTGASFELAFCDDATGWRLVKGT